MPKDKCHRELSPLMWQFRLRQNIVQSSRRNNKKYHKVDNLVDIYNQVENSNYYCQNLLDLSAILKLFFDAATPLGIEGKPFFQPQRNTRLIVSARSSCRL